MASNSKKKIKPEELARLVGAAFHGDVDATEQLESLQQTLGMKLLLPGSPAISHDFGYDEDDWGDDEWPEDELADVDELTYTWLRSLSDLEEAVGVSLTLRARKLDADELQIKSATPDGSIEAEYHAGSRRYRISVQLDLSDLSHKAGCTCFRSSKVSPCEHLALLAWRLLDYLDQPNASVEKLIAEVVSPVESALLAIDTFLAANPPPSEDNPRAEIVPEPTERIAWRLVDQENELYLEPVLQKQSKKGGWSPGRAVSFQDLVHQHRYPLSAIDARFVAAVEEADESYYGVSGRRLSIDQFAPGLESLTGHPAILLGNRPVTLERWNPRIKLTERPDENYVLGMEFLRDVPPGHSVKILVAEEYGVALVPSEPRLAYGRVRPAELQLVRKLVSQPIVVTPEQLPALQERLTAIGRVVSVEVPEALGGTPKRCDIQPILLVHARQGGELDVALRALDPHGCVVRAGEGVLRSVVNHDGERWQLWREPREETEALQSIARRLLLLANPTDTPWNYRLTEFGEVLETLDAAEAMARADELQIVWDERSVQKMTLLGSLSPQSVRVEVSRQRDWFGLKGTFRLGEREYSLSEMLTALDGQQNGRYLEVEPGKWAEISDRFRSRLLTLRETVHQNRKSLQFDATAAESVRELVGEDIELKATKAWTDCLQRIAAAKELTPEPSISFAGELRDYQLEGYQWLSRLAAWGVGGCLADDMGLGKTVQMLAVLVDRSETGPALVIAPTSVGFNWQKEAERFAPTLIPSLYRETERAEFLEQVDDGHIVICSYGLALRDAEALAKVKWGTLILDEAQFVKNARSKTAKAIRTIDAEWKVALTGTPMENHLGELWGLFQNISPGLFGAWEQFRKRFATPIEKHNDNERRQALARVIKPFLLRRTKAEVLTELPERTEVNLYVDLSAAERKRYDEMRLAAVAELDDIAGAPDTDDQRFKILALLTRLRQLSCHIGLVDDKWTKSSSKLDLLISTIQELKEEGHRALVFSQFTSHLDLIRSGCQENGISFQYLDGKTTAKQRQKRIDAFQSGEGDVFLISLKAGGTGLNLTAADYVIHTDPWWNPAVEDQATDRAHRIGQTKPVIVYRIISRDTIEEQILSLHADKRELVNSLLEGSESAAKYSTEELGQLIRAGAVETRS